MSGIDLLAPLKGLHSDLEAIMVTGYASVENAVQALNQGASAYIVKPVNIEDMLATVRVLLDKQRLVLENRRLLENIRQKLEERKRAEEKIEHLNLVLRAIRSVNQLVTREKDQRRLLKGVCDKLIETRGYYNAWLALVDEAGRTVTTAEAGLGRSFLPMLDKLTRGELTACGRKALSQAGIVVTEDPLSSCDDCPLSDKCYGRAAMTARLEHEGKVYGLLSVSLPKPLSADEEEQTLFQEVAGDIAFALHSMEAEEERKRAEDALRESKEFSDSLIAAMQDGLSALDSNGVHINVNPPLCNMTGFSREELIGVGPPHPYWPPEAYEEIDRAFQKTLRGEFGTFELTFMRKSGERFPVMVTPSWIRDRQGNLVSYFATVKDITERRRMQEQIIMADRLAAIGELASGIAHELNNPLSAVIGFSDLLLDKNLPDDVEEDLRVINREAKRTAGVVRNLLAFARKHPEEKQSVDINNVIEQVLELRAYEQKVNNIQVNTSFASDLPRVMANSSQLQQVFLNIIINAEHFMLEAHGRGTITITTEQAGDVVRASFADDGPGIAQHNLTRVFDPFFTTKEVGKGTGLGLSVSHGITTEHGGRIHAQSEPEKGATFVVELPISN
jgi:PAS domain S-box-containing protein